MTGSGRQVRRDPLSGRLVAVAPGRARRPGAGRGTREEPAGVDPSECPFCPGHEDQTPPETYALAPASRDADTPGWEVRVVPNLFPAFSAEEAPFERGGLLAARAARGVQEVVVNSPRHVRSLADLDGEELDRVADAWTARAAAARAGGFPYLHALVNEGRAAGASLAHTHSQLVWLEDEPPAVVEERRHAEAAESCLLCRLLAGERSDGARVVADDGPLVALAAYAGRQPYELLVAPDRCEPDPFWSDLLAPALRLAARALRALHAVEGPVAMNLWAHAGPHWHLELVPRMTVEAGVELGAGIFVTTLAAEEAARRLRDALATAPHSEAPRPSS